MKRSEKLDQFIIAFNKAQTNMQMPEKNKSAKIGSYTFRYADLGGVIDVIQKYFCPHGFSYYQDEEVIDGVSGLTTLIMHTSDQWVSSWRPFIAKEYIRPQDKGAHETFMRRYALRSAFGLADEDDTDGQTEKEIKEQDHNPSDPTANGDNYRRINEKQEGLFYYETKDFPAIKKKVFDMLGIDKPKDILHDQFDSILKYIKAKKDELSQKGS